MAAGRCSFCGLRRSEVDALVAGFDGAAICPTCAEFAANPDAEPPPAHERVYVGLARVVTNDPRVGGRYGTLTDAAIVVRRDHIAWLGGAADLPARYRAYPEIDCGGRIAVPGFVDAGMEILGDVPRRRPDPDLIIPTARAQLEEALANGVTSADIRVGGSGDPTIDTVLLAAARAAGEVAGPIRVGITWVAGSRLDPAYLDGVMAPTVGRIASAVEMACDGSSDAGSLSAQLATLRRLPVRVRLCEAEPRACAALAEGARSAESRSWTHLPADTVPVVEALALLDGHDVAVRELWDSGGRPAVATRSNPDGRQVNGMALAIAVLVTLGRLDVHEALWCATRGGALALGDTERGRLRAADPADFVVLDTDDLGDLWRRPDANPAWRVVVDGREALQ